VSTPDVEDPVGCADAAAEAVRALNHATRPAAAALTGPADAYAVLGNLALLASRLPQALTQLREYVGTEHTAGRLRIVDGEHTGDPAAAVTDLARQLCWATSSAEALRTALEQAQTTLTWAARADHH
jgi:hypothetical protein